MKVEKNKNLKNLNTYQIDVQAKYFLELKKKSDFFELLNFLKENKIKNFFILGGGSNVIFVNKKYNSLVVKISNTFSQWENKNRVRVGAGRNWDKFLASLNKKGFYDIQAMSSIPGTVGAAAFGNIGAFGTEVKKYIFRVEVFDLKRGEFIFLTNDDLNFSYRNSLLKKYNGRYIIYSVIFDFSKKFQGEINKRYLEGEYFSLKEFAKKHKLGKIKKSEIRKNIKKIRRSIYPDLKKYPNVGSTFKNTEISKEQLKKILREYPEISYWNLKNGKVKIPTAYIFDKVLNLNGKRFGNIEIDQKRPLFFKNMGGATGKEFYNLCQEVKKKTKKEMRVQIEEEVIFVF